MPLMAHMSINPALLSSLSLLLRYLAWDHAPTHTSHDVARNQYKLSARLENRRLNTQQW